MVVLAGICYVGYVITGGVAVAAVGGEVVEPCRCRVVVAEHQQRVGLAVEHIAGLAPGKRIGIDFGIPVDGLAVASGVEVYVAYSFHHLLTVYRRGVFPQPRLKHGQGFIVAQSEDGESHVTFGFLLLSGSWRELYDIEHLVEASLIVAVGPHHATTAQVALGIGEVEVGCGGPAYKHRRSGKERQHHFTHIVRYN